jgi:hypothetical protein
MVKAIGEAAEPETSIDDTAGEGECFGNKYLNVKFSAAHENEIQYCASKC